MQRGEGWWAALPRPRGFRPVLLVSRSEAYAVRAFCMVASVTTRIRGIRAEVTLGLEDGLAKESAANLDSMETVPVASLRERITMLTDEKMREVERAIHYTLALQSCSPA